MGTVGADSWVVGISRREHIGKLLLLYFQLIFCRCFICKSIPKNSQFCVVYFENDVSQDITDNGELYRSMASNFFGPMPDQ